MAKNNDLENKVFCLSGKLEMGKKHWQELIEAKGGICKSSVGKSTDYLVAGEGSGLKTKRAIELGIPCLHTDELEELLNN